MKQYKTIQVEKQVPEHIICNCCGQKIQVTKQHPYPEYVSIRKEWGYDSPYDGEVHEIDLCQDCYAKWIQTFKFPPQVEEEGCQGRPSGKFSGKSRKMSAGKL